MGVDLSDVVPRVERRLEDFQGKTIAIDGQNALYQFLSSIRQPDGTPLKDRKGRVTSHLSGLLYRTANLVEAGIRPVYVFDGRPPELKRATIEERRERKAKAEAEMQEALEEGDTARAFSKAQQTSHLSREMVEESKQLLAALGIPAVQAPGEGEAQAAHMAARGHVWAASSQDYDALLFGAPRLVRNLAVTGKRKLPGKSIWVDVSPEVVELESVLKELGVTREQLVDAGILVGTDFDPGVKGVGPKRAVKLVRDKGLLVDVLTFLEADVPEADQIREIFLKPEVADGYDLAFRPLDEARVRDLLVREHDFGEDRVKATFPRYAKLHEALKQRSLDAFF
ncbi:MAG TPA: flap endonuclease-1 [Candidatus Thermoplasmatota archaeon]|nr:flap endonuclease-1 [Candidatus Thermoplasmatota archaeon]